MPAQIAQKAMEAFAPAAADAYHRRLMDAYFADCLLYTSDAADE